MKAIFRKALIISLISLAVLFLLVFLLISCTYHGMFGHLPTREELRMISNEQASLVYSSDSRLIGKYFTENRTNVAWEDLPVHLIDALIATEDKRFFLHHGIDRRSYLRVIFKSILLGDRSSGGGSTISQQLAKNLFGRTFHGVLTIPVNKIREALLASRLEMEYSKDEILLLYFNSVPFGEEVFGVEAAANRFFDKQTRQLEVHESALLVGLLKANTYYNPRLNPENAMQRRNQVLAHMEDYGRLSPEAADSLQLLPLGLDYSNLNRDTGYEYFTWQVKKQAQQILMSSAGNTSGPHDLEKDGLRIYTTLDSRVQDAALHAVSMHLPEMQRQLALELKARKVRQNWEKEWIRRHGQPESLHDSIRRETFTWDGIKVMSMTRADSLWHYYSMLNAAVLVSDPADGSVLAWVGGNNYRHLPYDLVLAERQVASAGKPFIYAAALEKGLDPCIYLDNSPKKYSRYKDWQPANYDNTYTEDSTIAMWYALAHSMNLPTVDLYFMTGHPQVRDMLSRLGVEAPVEETPSVALGAEGASLYQMVTAYSAFAAGGMMPAEQALIDRITDAAGRVIFERKNKARKYVMEPGTAEQITAMLTRAVNEGTGSTIRSRFGVRAELAGKTGTAQNYSDAWFMAYTPAMVVGVWIGARSQEMHFNSGLGSGSSLALPVCGYLLQDLGRDPQLVSAFFRPFRYTEDPWASMDCDPFQKTGFDGFMERLKGKGHRMDTPRQRLKKTAPDQGGKEKKSFFKRIFGGKDKNGKRR